MYNRYNELTDEQKIKFNRMINSVASNRGDKADLMTNAAYQALQEMEETLWRIVRSHND